MSPNIRSSPSTKEVTPNPNPAATTTTSTPPLKVLFLSSDTGGGHRASATALGAQFERLYPDSTYDLLDITKNCSRAPYNNLESWYSHLSSNPNQWNLVYKVSNTKLLQSVFKIHFKMSTKESKLRQFIQDYEADVVISVHPLMNDIPVQSCMTISNKTNRHLPFFTVVTDLGGGHCTWFEKNVEKMFIASDAIETLARERGDVPKEKLVMKGLPIRYDFSVEAKRLGDRNSLEGKIYQLQMRDRLELLSSNDERLCHYQEEGIQQQCDRKVILVMGGGEGVGSLEKIVRQLYVQCSLHSIPVHILVVCGKNKTLKSSLENFDWESLLVEQNVEKMLSLTSCTKNIKIQDCTFESDVKDMSKTQKSNETQQSEYTILKQKQNKMCDTKGIASKVTSMAFNPLNMLPFHSKEKHQEQNDETNNSYHHIIEQRVGIEEEKKESESFCDSHSSSVSSESTVEPIEPTQQQQKQQSQVAIVKPLGFVTNMAEYMVAADLLLTKAGPGTIAEAASLGLPVLLTSFLPGQEEGNVDFVVEKKFGQYEPDSNPQLIALTVKEWLQNPDLMRDMSLHARKAGMPDAAEEIVKCIGKSVLRWKELHEEEQENEEEDIIGV